MNREYIVFAGRDHYNPLGIVRTLGECGIKSIVIINRQFKGPKMVPLSKYVKRCHYVDTLEEGIQLLLNRYSCYPLKCEIAMSNKSFILTGEDRVVHELNAHYEDLKDYFIFYHCTEEPMVSCLDKGIMYDIAEYVGFNIPKTWLVNPKIYEVPSDITYPVMTKAVNSFGSEWKDIVHVCYSERELYRVYGTIQSDEILLQEYIDKSEELSYDGFSVADGKDVSIFASNTQLYNLDGRYSPYWISRTPGDRDVDEKCLELTRRLVECIGLNGIFELELIVDKSGDIYFMEINLRPSVIFWAYHVAGIPVVKLWCDAMLSGHIDHDMIPKIKEGFTSTAECYDYDVRVKGGMISKRDWFKQLKNTDALLYKGRKDFLPFLSFMLYKFFHNRK